MAISSILINWYKSNQRILPWRETSDPYAIWLSEILLQQTRVDQGLPYYYRFIEQFPTVHDLAEAPNELIMKLWQGLGYYSRARNLHKTAQIIVNNYNGMFPSDFQLLKSLPGIGEYTASAIASFAFNLPHAVVDGNVNRVLSRLDGCSLPIDSSAGKKYFNQLAHQLLDKQNPGINNQAIMEFGALHCKPVNPLCESCPLSMQCIALNKGLVNQLPVKEKKIKTRLRYFNYLLIRHKGHIILNYRTQNDIWKNLFDFPVIETHEGLPPHAIINHSQWQELFSTNKVHIHTVDDLKPHKLSHQVIYPRLFDLELKSAPNGKLLTLYKMVPAQEIAKYAVPRVIEQVFEEKFESFYGK